jgi:hypothetical protein
MLAGHAIWGTRPAGSRCLVDKRQGGHNTSAFWFESPLRSSVLSFEGSWKVRLSCGLHHIVCR